MVFDLSGLDPEDIEVMADENTLRLEISAKEKHLGQRAAAQWQAGLQRERCSCLAGLCRKRPTALVKDGSLQITLPKCRPGGLHKIAVKHV